jgi:hypothetical protein
MGDQVACVPLLSAMQDEESLRVRNRIAGGLAERGWAVPEASRDTCRASLPDGFSLQGDKVTR